LKIAINSYTSLQEYSAPPTLWKSLPQTMTHYSHCPAADWQHATVMHRGIKCIDGGHFQHCPQSEYLISRSSYWTTRTKLNWTPWPESVGELYRQSDRHLSAKLVPTFADRGCHVVSVTNPYGRILGFPRTPPGKRKETRYYMKQKESKQTDNIETSTGKDCKATRLYLFLNEMLLLHFQCKGVHHSQSKTQYGPANSPYRIWRRIVSYTAATGFMCSLASHDYHSNCNNTVFCSASFFPKSVTTTTPTPMHITRNFSGGSLSQNMNYIDHFYK
jgi:hypothetical protein